VAFNAVRIGGDLVTVLGWEGRLRATPEFCTLGRTSAVRPLLPLAFSEPLPSARSRSPEPRRVCPHSSRATTTLRTANELAARPPEIPLAVWRLDALTCVIMRNNETIIGMTLTECRSSAGALPL
jgi:hypothetical protein